MDDNLAYRARELWKEYDLGALNALHIAAAEVGVADQFVTTEDRGKPLYRVAHAGPTFLGDLEDGEEARLKPGALLQAKACGPFRT